MGCSDPDRCIRRMAAFQRRRYTEVRHVSSRSFPGHYVNLLAANEWMGIIVPVRDMMVVELNLQFCVFFLGVLGAFAMHRKLAKRKGLGLGIASSAAQIQPNNREC